jgi:hypothetical protein
MVDINTADPIKNHVEDEDKLSNVDFKKMIREKIDEAKQSRSNRDCEKYERVKKILCACHPGSIFIV